MSETLWWQEYGPYHSWQKYPMLPDPGQVLHFYLDRRGIDPEQQVDYLMDVLDLKKSMIYNILRGDGLDAISRCRRLIRALEIYPPLLGIDAKFSPIELHPYWWKKYGYSFNADDQGYPEIHEIIPYLRLQTRGNHKVIPSWSQSDLGEVCGLSKEAAYRLEHSQNPSVHESMKLRFLMASVFAEALGRDEAIIFRLFGLSPEAYGVPVQAREYLPPVHFCVQLTDEIVAEYQQKLATFFTEYYDGRGENRVGEVREWLLQLPALLPRANTRAQQVHLLALQSRAHRYLACMAREQCEKEQILFHTDKAIELAEQVLTLYKSQIKSDRALLVTTSDLLAGARLTAALVSYELGELNLAREQIERVLGLPMVHSLNLKNELYGITALIRAYTVTGPMDQQLVLSSIDLALSKPSSCGCLDENFFRGDRCTLLMYKAWALAAPSMEGVTRWGLAGILEEAARYSPQVRQQILLEYLQALASLAQGDSQQAVEYATGALDKSKQVGSRLNKQRIEEVYQRLLQTSFKGQPCLVALGVKLRLWECAP